MLIGSTGKWKNLTLVISWKHSLEISINAWAKRTNEPKNQRTTELCIEDIHESPFHVQNQRSIVYSASYQDLSQNRNIGATQMNKGAKAFTFSHPSFSFSCCEWQPLFLDECSELLRGELSLASSEVLSSEEGRTQSYFSIFRPIYFTLHKRTAMA